MSDASEVPVTRLRAEIKRQGLKQVDIAAAVGCDQGQVSRLLKGTSSSRSRTYRQICEYVFRGDTAEREVGEQIIREALTDCWDGSSDDARDIATILRAVGTFGRHRKGSG